MLLAPQAVTAAGLDPLVLPDDLLPGVGGDSLSLRASLALGGTGLLALLTTINLLDYLVSAVTNALGPQIRVDLHLSQAAYGLITALPALFFVVAALPLGYLADRRTRVRLAGLTAAATSLVVLAGGGARTGAELGTARALTGAGQAAILPVHSSLLADGYPLRGRARVLGVHSLAPQVASIVGPLLALELPVFSGPGGWRVAYVVLAAPTLLAGLLLAFRAREPVRGNAERQAVLGTPFASPDVPEQRAVSPGPHDAESCETQAAPAPVPLALRPAIARLLAIPTFRVLCAAVGVLGFVLTAVPAFLSELLQDQYGLGERTRGLALAATEVGAVVGVVVGAAMVDRLFRRDPSSVILLLSGVSALYGTLFAAVIDLPSATAAVIGLTVVKLLGALVSVPLYLVAAAVVPYRLRSLAFAVLGLAIFLGGGFTGSVVTGLLADQIGVRDALVSVVLPASVAAGAVGLLAARTVRADLSGRVEEILEEQAEATRLASGGEVPALQVRGLDAGYGAVQVLFGVDLDVRRGEVLALLGTNGSGKSTLLRVISGLTPATRGVVRLDGRSITLADAPTRVRLGVVQVPGGRAVFPTLSVLENLRAGAFTLPKGLFPARLESVLELFPALRSLLGTPAGLLSGGEQQMLALAKALLLEPDVLLVDELSLGLAPVVVADLLLVVERLKAKGVTIVLVEQSVNVALELADRAVFLEKGRVRFSGPARDLAGRDDLVRAVFLGTGADGG